MNFNEHSGLKGEHAFLSPSKYAWVNYSEEKLRDSYSKYQATVRGTRLHAYACESILLKQKLPKSEKSLNRFVNDAIGFRMQPEQTLFYSFNCFGTTDAICFYDNILRIHDLKTGQGKVSMVQLEIYAAQFCLEYKIDPKTIAIILRIYFKDEVIEHKPDPETIQELMDHIVESDIIVEEEKKGGSVGKGRN